ncbi:MAG: sugar phosphate isomerase/epimerase family protein [Planctomycetota bacterium]
MARIQRRALLKGSLAAGAALGLGQICPQTATRAAEAAGGKIRLGLVTYLWGQDWDLPTLLSNCERTKMQGVELRVQHKHGVEPTLSAAERAEVRNRFADSPVIFVGPGTNDCYDNPDPAVLRKNIESTKAYIKLSHDCGGSGVKVKPNDLHKNVPQEQTIAQIARGLNKVGKFAADFGQQIRLEVHGKCGPIPIIKQIIDQVTEPNVGLCWNCNGDELQPPGLEYHFNLVKDRFGSTAHVRELNEGDYPYQELIKLFVGMDYDGWILFECRTKPADRVAALHEQRKVFEEMLAKARG